MVPNWSTKELKTGPIEQYIATNNDVFFGLLPLPTTHTELPQQWRFREINASNDEYYRPSSVFDSFMMRRCYGICFRWPQGNIRWVYTPPINLEIAYDNLEFQVVVRFQVAAVTAFWANEASAILTELYGEADGEQVLDSWMKHPRDHVLKVMLEPVAKNLALVPHVAVAKAEYIYGWIYICWINNFINWTIVCTWRIKAV